MIGPQIPVVRRQTRHPRLFSVLLEKQLTRNTGWCADHRKRPVLQVGQHPLGNAFVVPDQVKFCDAA